MTEERLIELLTDENNWKIENEKNTYSSVNDLNLLLMFNGLVPKAKGRFIGGTSHDLIYFDVEVDELAKVVTEEQVREMIGCGLMYDEDYERGSVWGKLCAFV